MKIRRISVYHVDLPLKEPYWLAGGRLRFDVLDASFVKLETDTGHCGWGEATPWGHTYVPAHGPGVRAGIQTLAPAILNADPRQTDNVNYRMDACLPGHLYCKQPIDMACWDLMGQVFDMPIAEVLGNRRSSGTYAASSISTGSNEQMLQNIQRYRDMGYRAHSAKVGGSELEKPPGADTIETG